MQSTAHQSALEAKHASIDRRLAEESHRPLPDTALIADRQGGTGTKGCHSVRPRRLTTLDTWRVRSRPSTSAPCRVMLIRTATPSSPGVVA